MNITNDDIVVQVIEFLTQLRKSEFSIGPDTHIESLKILKWLSEKEKPAHINLQKIASYLSPVICKSDEEQDRFNSLFKIYFIVPLLKLEGDRNDEEKRRIKIEEEKTRKKRISIITWITAALFLFAAIWFFQNRNDIPGLNYSGLASQNFFVHKDQNESLTTQTIFRHAKDSSDFNLENKFFDDGTAVSGINPHHAFKKYGKDSVRVFISQKENRFDTNVLCRNINIGPSKNPEINPEKTLLTEGDENTYTIDIDTNYKTTYYLKISRGDTTIKMDSNTNQVTCNFSKTGDYLIQFWYDTLSDNFLRKFPEEYKSVSLLQKVSLASLHLDVNKKDSPDIISAHINTWWVILLVCIILFFIFFALKAWQSRSNVKDIHAPEISVLKGDKPPFEIPVLSKEHNINTEYKLLRLSNELRKRVESNVEEINLKKTIVATIGNIGFLTPRYDKKQIIREYLFLIDQAYYNSQQVRLFEYLVQLLKNRSVELDFYFYYQAPENFYEKNDKQKRTLTYIKNRHYDASLIFIADGQSFIDFNAPVVKKSIENNFLYWQTRILVTPVPFNDWGGNEKALSGFFKLIPADIQGLLQLVKFINEEENPASLFSQTDFFSYESKYVDFNDEKSLREYLNDEDIFQWLCATAVYSKIRWEVFLETGKTILKDKTKINYKTLLKFVRIKWMQEGSFPASTRLMLLKQLTVENELKTRDMMLQLFNEVPVGSDSYSLEEKQLNLFINSFVLYASGKKGYDKKDIQENAEKFISLYTGNKLLDMPLKIYIEKKEDGEVPWETPIISNNKNVGIEEYISEKNKIEKKDQNKQKQKQLFKIISPLLAAFAAILFLFYLYFFPQKIINTGINEALHFADTAKKQDSRVVVRITPGKCMMQLLSSLKDSLLTFEASAGNNKLLNSSFKLNFKLKDYDTNHSSNAYNTAAGLQMTFDTFALSVPVGKNYTNNTPINYTLTVDNQKFETTTNAGFGIYDLSVSGKDCTPKISIDYYPGYGDDTAKIFKGAKKWKDSMNINIHEITKDHLHANYVIFGEGIDSSTKYEVTSFLVKAGFPLIRIYNKTGSRDKIEINGADSINKKPLISLDSLRCLYFDACAKQFIQIIYNDADYAGKINQFSSCIGSNNISTALSLRASSNFRGNVIRYYRTSFADSLKFLQSCFKTYFPIAVFPVEKATSPLPQNAAAQIYVYHAPDTATKVTIEISDKVLLQSANAFRAQLMNQGFQVDDVQVSKRNYNSVIIYYDSKIAKQADAVKTMYRKYYPNLPINTILSAGNGSVAQRDISHKILIWIKKYDSVPPPGPKSWIENVKYALNVRANDSFYVSFDVMANTTALLPKTVLQTNALNAAPNRSSNIIFGKICVYSDAGNCTDFSLSGTNSRTHISRLIDITKKASGKHELRVLISDLKIDTSIGFFTVAATSASTQPCFKTSTSLAEASKSPLDICTLDLSDVYLKRLPQGLIIFKNLQKLVLGFVGFTPREIQSLKDSLPQNCIIEYYTKGILWVDDHPENNQSLINDFKNEGIGVIIAKSTAEAILRIQQRQSFNVVISDISRDNEGSSAGLQIGTILKKYKVRPPIIFYSDKADINKYEASKLGAVLITDNPVELKSKVNQIMQTYSLTK